VTVELLAQAPGHVHVLPAGAPRTAMIAGGVRSYVADGRCVVWAPPGGGPARLAVDAEIAAQPVPPALARRSGITDPAVFWPLWTSTEVSCKIAGVSLARWLQRHGLQADEGLDIRTFTVADLVVSCTASG
jgi:hypothetical protein